MIEKKNVPKLRFLDFTSPWEQHKVGELLIERNDKAPMSDEYPLMAFIANEGVAPKGERYDRSALVNDVAGKLYKKTEYGDFIYSSNNLEVGSIGLNKYGKACISPVYSIFKSTGLADSDFIGRRFIREDFINAMIKWRQGVIYGQWRIHESDFIKIEVAVPSVEEQRKIGVFLDQYDTLITLQQRKLDQIKEYKKGMLQKMFPKDGASVPEVRFPGFTGEWEHSLLGEYCEMFNGDRSAKYPNAQDMVPEGIPFINAGDLVDGRVNLVSANKITREKYNDLGGAKLKLGDIVYCLRGTLGKNAYIDNFTEGTVASSLVAIRPKNIDGKYLFHILNSEIEYRQRVVRDEGAAQPNLSAKSVSEYIIPVPSREEQQEISAFLDDLGDLVTLHQRKLDAMKEYKKGLLQQMFV